MSMLYKIVNKIPKVEVKKCKTTIWFIESI